VSHRIPTRKVPSASGGALVASRIVSTTPCKVLGLLVYNDNAAMQYIQVHEAAAVPADNAVPALPAIPVAGKSFAEIDFGQNGIDLDACVVCNSSAAAVKTIGAADCSIVGILLG
jgi:hypothetical protein